MRYWRKGLVVIPAAAALMLAAGPVLAQSLVNTIKQSQQALDERNQASTQAYMDLLSGAPPDGLMGTNIRATIAALNDGSVPPLAPPGASSQAAVAAAAAAAAAQATLSTAMMQQILGGLINIQAEVDSKPTPPSPAAAMAATAAELIGRIEDSVARLQREKRAALLAAAQAASSAGAVNDAPPPPSSKTPPVPPPGFTAPPANNGEPAMVAALLNNPGVVAAVRDQTVTAALKGWDDTFSAAWPDYAENNAYYPGIFFAGSYGGDALAVMPDGSSSTGSLSIYVDFVDNRAVGSMSFAASDPSLAGNLTFSDWLEGMGDGGGIDDNAAAFGGALSNGVWSSGYYGPVGDIIAGNWSATISGGPNAGIVVGKFGGSQ